MKKYFYLLAFAFLLTANAFSQNVTVTGVLGASSVNTTYATLNAAFTAINGINTTIYSQSGATITIAISGNTTEPNSTPSNLADKGWSTLKIYPTVDNAIITGSYAGAVISLYGASRVTIDGRKNADTNTSTKCLTITNTNNTTSTNTCTISLRNDAQYNTIQYCTLKGSATVPVSNTGGIILFFTALSTGTGNNNNTITNCDFTNEGGNRPTLAICSSGTSGKTNKNNTISYNNFYNLFNATIASTCINLKDNSDNFTIQGNNFYETSTFTTTGTQSYIVINTGSTVNSCTIKDNYIGGSAPGCSGTWIKAANMSAANNFTAIVSTNPTGTPTCNIQNNTIKGFDFTNNSGAATVYTWAGITLAGTGDVSCQGNTISSVVTKETDGTAVYTITCITKTATTGTATIKNNVIGSLSNSKDINASSASSTSCNVVGIYYAGVATSGISYIEDNMIANLNNSSTLTTGSGTLGIYINSSTAHTIEVNRNFIFGLSESGNARLFGLRCGPVPSTACNVTNNIISLSPGDNSLIQGGIYHSATNANYYHNTVFIGGSGNGESVALYNNVASGLTFKNNIFVNTRTNNDATNHLAYRSTLTTTNTLDYNDFYVDGSNGFMLAAIGSTLPYTVKAIGEFGDTHSQNVDPAFYNAGGFNATDYKSYNGFLVGVSLSGVVPYDYTGITLRVIPVMGAYETRFSQTINSSGSIGTSPLLPGTDIIVNSGIELTVDNASTTVHSITVNAGGKLTLTGAALNVGALNLLSDVSNGTGTFVDQNANGGLTVTGTTTVNQSLQADSPLRTWYITTPVASATPTPALSIIKYFDETINTGTASDNWVSTTTMTTQKGYQVVPIAGNDISFSGTLNNGDQNIALTSRTGTTNYAGFNLIGNPYPSYLDWNLVTANTANIAIMRSTTMWYRTKSTGVYSFWTVNGDGVTSPNGASPKIPPMQAFWIKAKTGGGSLALTNAMRSHAPATDMLLKAPAAKNTANTLVRLQVSNGTNTDEAVLYLSANASNGMDVYDAPKMSNNDVAIPEIYTTVGAEHMVINAMNTIPLDTPIGLGFVPGNATSFSLTANEISNLPTGVKVILKDNITNAETDLTDGVTAYQFSPVVTSSDRFSVIFRSAGATTSVETPQDISMFVYSNAPQQLTVMCKDIHLGSMLSVYNAIGQKLVSQQLTSTSIQIGRKFSPGVYMVKVNNTIKKVIIN